MNIKNIMYFREGIMPTSYQNLLDEINELMVIDVHDYIMIEEDRNDKNFFYFFPHYISSDVVSAEMDFGLMNKLINLKEYSDEEVKVFFKYWEKAKNTTYSKSLLRKILQECYAKKYKNGILIRKKL